MPLPLMQAGAPALAKFAHENGTQLRLQVFVLVEDAEGRVALQRLQGIDGWCLSGENLQVNESPDEGAQRVCRLWYASPLAPRLERVLSFPATGGEDVKWYLVFIYRAKVDAPPARTQDCEALAFFALDAGPDAFAMAHDDVWDALRTE